MVNEELKNIVERASDIIANIDSGEAKQLLDELSAKSFGGDANFSNLRNKLRIIALPVLPENEALEVLRGSYLLSYQIGVSMEDQITAALFVEPLLSRDELRKKFQKALLENQEKIGNITIGKWIHKFENMFDIRTRDEFALVKFLMRDENATMLDQMEIKKLKDVLHDYDCLLTVTLPATEPRLSGIINRMQKGSLHDGNKNITENNNNKRLNKNVQMTLQEALNKYEKLGEQHLSGNPIKLKIFEAPVRPSIKNWIADYYEKVDARKHDSIERGNYLFHSENARRLTTGERQKVGTMLRALDEDSMISVDTQRQEMVFGSNGEESDIKGEKGMEGVKRGEMGVKGESGGMSFSSGQRLPYEQKIVSPAAPVARQNQRSNNVVDLKNDSLN